MSDDAIKAYLQRIGATGGKSGRGPNKTRGDRAHYAELGRRGAAARKAKQLTKQKL